MSSKKDTTTKELFDNLNKAMIMLTISTQMIVWLSGLSEWSKKTGKLIVNIVCSLIGSAWVSMLILYIWTQNFLYLKIFLSVLAIVLILSFQIALINSIIIYRFNKKQKKLKDEYKNSVPDMSELSVPDENDFNVKYFDGYAPKKYVVSNETDALFGKRLFLYPVYCRLNDNKTIIFFKADELTEIIENNNNGNS